MNMNHSMKRPIVIHFFRVSLVLSSLFLMNSAWSQTPQALKNLIHELEGNSLSLKSIHTAEEANRLEYQTNLFLPNPELGFNYLWSSPAAMGNRRDVTLVQSFDFPTAYVYRSDLSDLQIKQSMLAEDLAALEMRYEISLLYYELVYRGQMEQEWSVLEEHAEQLTQAYQQRLDAGDIGIMELHKVELNGLKVANQRNSIQTEIDQLLLDLKVKNGGQLVELNAFDWDLVSLPASFDDYYLELRAKNPILMQLENGISMAQKQVQLQKALRLPRWSAGYMDEYTVFQNVQGISVGMSLPLWEQKNKVKWAKANQLAAQSALEEYELYFRVEAEKAFRTALKLDAQIRLFEEKMAELNQLDRLGKALDSGQISLMEYLFEINFYTENTMSLLKLKRDLRIAWVNLHRFSAVD